MSTFRHIDTLLEGKTSDELASDVAARARQPTEGEQQSLHRPPGGPPDLRPLVARTSGSVTDGIYGLVLALSVIAVSLCSGPSNAGRIGLSVLVTAIVFWLAHVYASVLARDMSQERRLTRAEVVRSLREHWSLIEVIPLLLVLGLGAIGLIADAAAIIAATAIASLELAAAGGYAAARHGASPRGVIASGATGLTLGLLVVLLKAVAFMH